MQVPEEVRADIFRNRNWDILSGKKWDIFFSETEKNPRTQRDCNIVTM